MGDEQRRIETDEQMRLVKEADGAINALSLHVSHQAWVNHVTPIITLLQYLKAKAACDDHKINPG